MSTSDTLEARVEQYFQGLYRGDTALLADVFDSRAPLFGEVRGTPYYKNLADYLAVVAARQSPQSLGEPFAMQHLSTELSGPLAVTKLRCIMLGNDYIDYLSWVQENGIWRIVAKIFAHFAPQES